MNIGVDIRVLGSPKKSGIQEYTEQLLAAMISSAPDITFTLFYTSFHGSLPHYPWLYFKNVKRAFYKIPNRLLFGLGRTISWPHIDKILGVQTFFSPHFFLLPLSSSCRRVTTFHDLSFERFPNFFSWRKNMWHTFEMMPSWQSRFSDKIIAVSESTKRDLVEFYNIDPQRISVIYSGVASSIKRPLQKDLDEFRKNKKLPRQFVLYLGTLEPRKNISGLIEAFSIAKKNPELKDLHLVIAGEKGWLYGNIFKAIQNSPYEDFIHCPGYIADVDRPYYYSLASVFAYPSYFEGFGIPPLEAMACGTPVIAGSTSSLPEVVGDAGLLVDPRNISEISFAIESIVLNKSLQNRYESKGRERLPLFSWEKAAEQTLEILVG